MYAERIYYNTPVTERTSTGKNSHPKHTERIDIINQRREHRIVRNRIRRQQEMRQHFLLFLITFCLIITCSFTLSTFRSNAKNEPVTSYKCYKSIAVSNKDTLWSIATEYMDEEHYTSITDYIAEIKNTNAMSGDAIHYGEYLIIPYYAP